MKKIYIKINDSWLKLKRWGEISILGYLISSIIKLILILAVLFLLFYSLFIIGPFKEELTDSFVGDSSDTANDNCTVAGINLHGTILTYIPQHSESDTFFDYDTTGSENVLALIRQANEDEKIKSIVIEVDSGGGSPVGGQEIDNAVKNSEKPVVSFIRSVGASAAYLSVSSSDKIFASIYSDVGSIGITGSYLNNVQKNQKEGYTLEQLSVGRFKDAGSPDKALTSEEKAIFQRDLTIAYNYFVEAVSQNRKIPINEVKGFADGSTVLGEKAKELGLIDEIGGISEVEKYLEETIGEKPEICWQ